MSRTERYTHDRGAFVINDTLSDDVLGDDCPNLDCDDNHDGFWSERIGGPDGKKWLCHCCDEVWNRE